MMQSASIPSCFLVCTRLRLPIVSRRLSDGLALDSAITRSRLSDKFAFFPTVALRSAIHSLRFSYEVSDSFALASTAKLYMMRTGRHLSLETACLLASRTRANHDGISSAGVPVQSCEQVVDDLAVATVPQHSRCEAGRCPHRAACRIALGCYASGPFGRHHDGDPMARSVG